MKFKRLICLLLIASLLVTTPVFYAYASANSEPLLSYTFEDSSSAPSLFGNAALTYDEDKKGKVLSLDGSSGTYAEITQGFFDGKDTMTVLFDIKPNANYGNYFTFTIGRNNEVYDFFRIRANEIRNAITLNSYNQENETIYHRDNTQTWMHIAMVFDGTYLALYVDGELVSENQNTNIRLSDMGSNLISYFGKSFYNGDGYFSGSFDNFEVYGEVLSDSKIKNIAEENLPLMPSLRYTFEDGDALPSLFGNAGTVYDSDKKSKVLSLDGSSGTYAEIPQGFFDGKDKMTIIMDVKNNQSSGNYFTFCFGRDNTVYDFLRIRGSEIRNAINNSVNWDERETRTSVDFASYWMNIALVFDNEKCSLYVNGKLEAQNSNTGYKVSDLGSDLLSYLGKSFYDGDGYFKGYFDNFEVYDEVLDEEFIKEKAQNRMPLLIGINIGDIESNLDSISGTDSHTTISTTVDRGSREVTSIIQRRQNIKSVKVSIYTLNGDCEILVDKKKFVSVGYLDLSYDRTLTIKSGNYTETYTIKAPQIANNPVLPGMYADPDIDVFEGKFWIYPTTDGTIGWGGTQFHAFSSKDMVHWNDEGVILDVKDKSPSENDKGIQIASSKWSDGNAWAPAIEGKNGKYYFYYCGHILKEYTELYGEGMAIGVAYADSPEGPYTALDSPIVYPKMMSEANIGFAGQVIDPSVYTDARGNSYLLFGNGMAAIAALNSNMTSVVPSSLVVLNGLDGFRESIAVFRRNGLYYFTWSCDDTGSENYHINYGTSSSLWGPVTFKGTIVQKDPSNGILATGHQSVLYLPESDRCFIAYHRFYTPLSIGGNVGHHRETCIEELTFSGNTINAVTPSMEGVSAVSANGENLTEIITQPTCTQDGIIREMYNGEVMITLNADDAPELKAAGHSFVKTVHTSNCTDDGYDEYRCTKCGETYRDNIDPASGHDISSEYDRSTSHFTINCSRCGYEKDFVFNDYAGTKENGDGYDKNIDINGDGIINGRDLAHLLNK